MSIWDRDYMKRRNDAPGGRRPARRTDHRDDSGGESGAERLEAFLAKYFWCFKYLGIAILVLSVIAVLWARLSR